MLNDFGGSQGQKRKLEPQFFYASITYYELLTRINVVLYEFEVTTVTNLQAHNLTVYTQKYAVTQIDLPIKGS